MNDIIKAMRMTAQALEQKSCETFDVSTTNRTAAIVLMEFSRALELAADRLAHDEIMVRGFEGSQIAGAAQNTEGLI